MGRPTFGQAAGALAVVGLAALSYLGGAAVMHFDLPSSDFLGKAFAGAAARIEDRGWLTTKDPATVALTVVTVDDPDKTFDGFTLTTTTAGCWATLVDMRGNVVHRWQMPFSRAFPRAPQAPFPPPDEQLHWFRTYLYPNGDLLAVYMADNKADSAYGLAKLDKDSNLVWAFPACVHHDVDVGEDGRIYTLTQKTARRPPAGLSALPTPYIAESLLILAPDGRQLDKIPLLEAVRDSPYAQALLPDSAPSASGFRRTRTVNQPGENPGDVLHANAVRVLRAARAPRFPLFKAGQVVVSLRSLDCLIVVDPATRSVTWAATGVWRKQHDPEFLDNGDLLLFDNAGAGDKGSRVLEYDPVTQSYPWSYGGGHSPAFTAEVRGVKQRLPNGNTLIADPDGARVLEVTADKELVWMASCPCSNWLGTVQPCWSITGVHRYTPAELTFLRDVAGPRP
jgi:hypothetical protein